MNVINCILTGVILFSFLLPTINIAQNNKKSNVILIPVSSKHGEVISQHGKVHSQSKSR